MKHFIKGLYYLMRWPRLFVGLWKEKYRALKKAANEPQI